MLCHLHDKNQFKSCLIIAAKKDKILYSMRDVCQKSRDHKIIRELYRLAKVSIEIHEICSSHFELMFQFQFQASQKEIKVSNQALSIKVHLKSSGEEK